VLLASHDARADEQPEAQKLFDRGVQGMLAKRYEQACADIEASYRLDPLPGVMFTLAECLASAGKVVSAISRYRDFRTLLAALPTERRSVFDERDRLAQARAVELEARIAELTIVLEKPVNTQRLTLEGDGSTVIEASKPVPLDPGSYVIVAEAPGRRRWSQPVTVEAGQRLKLSVPELEPVEKQAPLVAAKPALPEPVPPRRRTWVYVSGAVGAAGLTAGLVAGAFAWNRRSKVETHCPARSCDATGADALQDGRAAATVSNVAFGVAVAGLAGAAIIWLTDGGRTAPPRSETKFSAALELRRSGGALALQGAFE